MNVRRSGKVPIHVVAEIIIIAVIVAVAIAVEAWTEAHEQTFVSPAILTPLQITSTRFVSERALNNATGYITLTIKCTDTHQVTVGQAKVNNVAAIIDSSSTLTYSPSMSGSIMLDNVTWSNGNSYKIDLYDVSGTGVGSTQQNAPA